MEDAVAHPDRPTVVVRKLAEDEAVVEAVFVDAWSTEDVLALAHALRFNTVAVTVDIRHVDAKAAVIVASSLEENDTVASLGIVDCSIDPIGAKNIADSLSGSWSLSTLNLSSNCVGDEGTSAISGLLRRCETLKRLDLSSNGISDEGATAIADALRHQICNMTELRLSDNSIGDRGAASIACALGHNVTLETLALDHNVNLCDDGMCSIANMLMENYTLTCLDLSRNKRVSDKGASCIASALRRNESLTELQLFGTSITDSGASELANALKSNFAMRRCNLRSDQSFPRISNAVHYKIEDQTRINSTGSLLEVASRKSGSFPISLLEEKHIIAAVYPSLIERISSLNLSTTFSFVRQVHANLLSFVQTTQSYKIGENSNIVDEISEKGEDDVQHLADRIDNVILRADTLISFKDQMRYAREPSLVVESFLWLGPMSAAKDRNWLEMEGITHILNCADDTARGCVDGRHYLQLCAEDDEEYEVLAWHFQDAWHFLNNAKRTKGAKVLVHCHAGVNRSAAIVVAWLMKNKGMSVFEAVETTFRARPVILSNKSFVRELVEMDLGILRMDEPAS